MLALVERDKKREGGRVPFVLMEAPGEVTPGHEVDADELRAAVEEVRERMNHRVDVLHGVNLDVLGRRPAAHYGGLTLNELEVKVKRFADELGIDVAFFQTNHEGEFCESLHRADRADGLLLNPGAWTHYSYAIRDALEVAACPPSRCTSPRSTSARSGGACP